MADFPSKQLLFDFFAGKSTALQKQWIADWLKEPANQIIYYQYLNDWESQHPQYQTDVHAALGNFHEAVKLHAQELETPVQPLDTKITYWNIRATRYLAASFLILMAMGGYFGRNLVKYQTYRTDYGETRTFKLADGTTVSLNANSELMVPRWGFGEQDRKVLLDGEAEFKVSHLPHHQKFVVKTSTDFAVEVLGTEFLVYARQRRRKVILSEGSVKVTYQPGKQFMMKPGDWVDLGESGKLLRKTTDKPTRFSSWKQHKFTFDQTSLAEISILIREHFGLNIIINDPDLAQRKVSGVFEAQKSSELVEALADLLHLNAVNTADGIELSQPADPTPAKSPKSK